MLTRPLVIVLMHAERAADEEPAAEHLPQVAHLVELVPDEAGAHRVVVGRERASGTGASSAVCETAANAASAASRPDSTA